METRPAFGRLTSVLASRFWWLDLTTLVMEPSYSLQSHIFDDLGGTTQRNISVYNPLEMEAGFPERPYLEASEQNGGGGGGAATEPIDMIVPQDCAGFNLGSFFLRRSVWTERLLDSWWDPVAYEQKHMVWEHKEQDALECLYANQPWIRSRLAFIPQRKINSFPQAPAATLTPPSTTAQRPATSSSTWPAASGAGTAGPRCTSTKS